ncbi:MAG: hypothetical protein LUC31_01835 [Coprobacillus sp.]|nr:hypothetical protein [Coprobacillus sp.]
MPEEAILEPLDLYNRTYKHDVHEAGVQYFDDCVEKAGVDLAVHRENVKKYNAAKGKYALHSRKASNLRGWRVFLIILAVLGGIAALAGFILIGSNGVAAAVLIPVGIVVLVASILVICLALNRRIRQADSAAAKHKKDVDELREKCMDDVRRVTSLFEWNIPTKIIRENVPLIQIDDTFDMKKYDYLSHKYNIGDNNDKNTSTVFLLSGTIAGNPFLFVRNFYTYMGQKTYTGTLPVTVPVRVYDGERWVTTMKTEILTATLEEPAPFYNYETFLVYGNDSAPNLTFSRKPTISKLDNDKDIDKYVKSETKKLDKTADKAIKKGGKFTPMSNEEFETIFHAWNRNNEVEFRLLYTPLAQENTLKLLKRTTPNNPYGDDWQFSKRKCLNYVTSEHSQMLDVYMRPDRYVGYYDLDKLKKDFVEYIDNYFKCLYFDIAPIISIPLYQQMQPREFIYQDSYDSNYTMLEDECAVNAFPRTTFVHPHSATDAILKTKILKKHNNYDEVKVSAYSYTGTERVTPVTVPASNGHLYAVPVKWVEYHPIKKDSVVNIANNNAPKTDYKSCFDRFNETQSGKLKEDDNFIFHHRFIVMLRDAMKSDNPEALDNFIDDIFGYKNDPNSSDSKSSSISDSTAKTIESGKK